MIIGAIQRSDETLVRGPIGTTECVAARTRAYFLSKFLIDDRLQKVHFSLSALTRRSQTGPPMLWMGLSNVGGEETIPVVLRWNQTEAKTPREAE
jgi:hypothetical protein